MADRVRGMLTILPRLTLDGQLIDPRQLNADITLAVELESRHSATGVASFCAAAIVT